MTELQTLDSPNCDFRASIVNNNSGQQAMSQRYAEACRKQMEIVEGKRKLEDSGPCQQKSMPEPNKGPIPSNYNPEEVNKRRKGAVTSQRPKEPINTAGNNCGASTSVYVDIGDPDFKCEFCGALFWTDERIKTTCKLLRPKFNMCCNSGRVILLGLAEPPECLKELFLRNSQHSKIFLRDIRAYNTVFAFTSMGGKVVHSVNNGRGPYIFKIHGQNYHQIGSLVPSDGNPKFSQLYIYDTGKEVENRLSVLV